MSKQNRFWVLSVIVVWIVGSETGASVTPADRSHAMGHSLESTEERASLPIYRTVPAANGTELTPASKEEIDLFRTWRRSNADMANTRYSALAQINRGNVSKLEVAWIHRSGEPSAGIKTTPVIVDGVMYAPTAARGKAVVAINAETGVEIWRFGLPDAISTAFGERVLRTTDHLHKPSVNLPPDHPSRHERDGNSGTSPVAQGIIYWEDDRNQRPRLFFMIGGYLVALDAKTGRLVETFGDQGMIASTKGATKLLAPPPVIYKEVLVAASQNFAEAFDVVSGARLWQFNTLHYAVDDTTADNGGNVWGGMAMDTARGIVYFAVGDPHPNFVGVKRLGDNKHTNSVVALDAMTGRLIWSFQDIAHDLWDLDIPAPPNLVTVKQKGKRIDAVAQVTKQGNTLLLDRLTGKPIFPFRLRRAPTSRLPGERTAPYQPALELPEPFARQEFRLDDITTITPAARAHVIEQVRNANFGWFEPFEEGKPTVFYGVHGGAEWPGAAFDPIKHILYVSSNELASIVTVSRVGNAPQFGNEAVSGARIYQQQCAICHGALGEGKGTAPPMVNVRSRLSKSAFVDVLRNGKGSMAAIALGNEDTESLLAFLFLSGQAIPMEKASLDANAPPSFVSDGFPKLLDDRGYPGVKPPWGTLNAIDLDTGRILWKVPLGEHQELTEEGVPQTGTHNFGGPMVTAGGVVFCAGTLDRKIRAFDQTNGAQLWEFKLPFGGYAPPATYEVRGRQYVVIAATGGGKLGGPIGDMYVAFALPQK